MPITQLHSQRIQDAPQSYGKSRQAIINGNFDVWQRGTSFGNPLSGQVYCADRWICADGTGTSTITRQAFTLGQTDVPGNPKYYLQQDLTVTGAGTAFVAQKIEGVESFAGETITLSFWAKVASGTLSVTPVYEQYFGSGGSPSTTVTINGSAKTVTTTWTKFTDTIAITSISGKTLGTDGNDSLWVEMTAPVSATYTLSIAQVQVCAGSEALPFEPKSFGQELQSCQRYYEKSYDYADAPATTTSVGVGFEGRACYTGTCYFHPTFQVQKRATPTIAVYSETTGTAGQIRNVSDGADVSATISLQSEKSFQVTYTATDIKLYRGHYTASAEL